MWFSFSPSLSTVFIKKILGYTPVSLTILSISLHLTTLLLQKRSSTKIYLTLLYTFYTCDHSPPYNPSTSRVLREKD
ncbi:hypothetical protein HanIR_Chr04g0185841 [Helianthus annuus]|nr:hypothetical protein HanIR_Chr04g0185841 [Helianthus annuus]